MRIYESSLESLSLMSEGGGNITSLRSRSISESESRGNGGLGCWVTYGDGKT